MLKLLLGYGAAKSEETKYYMNPKTGAYYPKKLSQTLSGQTTSTYGTHRWDGCTEMEEVDISGFVATGSAPAHTFANCTKLKTAKISGDPAIPGNTFSNCTALETAIIGGIGKPISTIGSTAFSGCTQSTLTIEIYVTESATLPLASSPWGATNAEVVYRSSVDGHELGSR